MSWWRKCCLHVHPHFATAKPFTLWTSSLLHTQEEGLMSILLQEFYSIGEFIAAKIGGKYEKIEQKIEMASHPIYIGTTVRSFQGCHVYSTSTKNPRKQAETRYYCPKCNPPNCVAACCVTCGTTTKCSVNEWNRMLIRLYLKHCASYLLFKKQ